MESFHTDLELGESFTFDFDAGSVDEENSDIATYWKYFKYYHTRSDMAFRISLKGLTSESDGDIFVSTKEKKPTRIKSKWKNTTFGDKSLEIHTSHDSYEQGTYYIAVCGKNSMTRQLEIILELINSIENVPIKDGLVQSLLGTGEEAMVHHCFKVRKAENLKLEIHISPGFPKVVAYLSSEAPQLPARECDWVVGLFQNDEVTKNMQRSSFTCNPFYIDYESKKIQYDPTLESVSTEFGDLSTMDLVRIKHRSILKLKLFDEYEEKKKNEDRILISDRKYTNFQVSDEVIEASMDKVIEELKEDLIDLNQDSDMTPQRPYIICLDAEAFKFSQGICYLALENLSGEEISYKIKILEKHEFDICDKHTQKINRVYSRVFSHIDPSQISHQERDRLDLCNLSQYTYGEVKFRYFYPILTFVKPQEGEIFWDIGCGACKPMIIAAIGFPQLKAVKGVEFVDGLYELGKQNIEELHKEVDEIGDLDYCKNIEIQHGDLLQTDWSEADILYISSVCFNEEMLKKINEMSNDCKVGTRMITLKKLPKNPNWKDLHTFKAKMSWGPTEVFISHKIT
ncbi:unnamed protein product [Moneuplotes crassus]|uniref:Histone-lysine N-methyltransferase, H3 lysine-79 specific n=1 Tax=Euplotes crassus TaxID=5936 RepID=A0AAD1UBQ8_EUPCR|nr:unnamed protein product [Moneuplotes crassus]